MGKDLIFFNPQPKPYTWASEKYRKFVRKRPCAFCDKPGPNEFHHIRWIELSGVGVKPSDCYGVPACKSTGCEIGCHDKDQQYKIKHSPDLTIKILRVIISQLNDFVAKGRVM